MQTRSRDLEKNQRVISTPMIVPSFSSKGFRMKASNEKYYSEINDLIECLSDHIQDTVLVSSYDLYYYIKSKKIRNYLKYSEVLFIDSGGYETLDGHELSDIYKYPNCYLQEWTQEMHKKTLAEAINKEQVTVIVSYDHGEEKRVPLKSQIIRAEKLFRDYSNCFFDFLIKPEKKGEDVDFISIEKNISLLRNFDIIGITEKELGLTMHDRLKNICKLRRNLDKVNNNAPIHIFGSLDPISCIQYFIAGAEIFDGLTWLRFGFLDGKAIYKSNYGAIKELNSVKDYLVDINAYRSNLTYLQQLKNHMKSFHKTNDLRDFSIDESVVIKTINFLNTI